MDVLPEIYNKNIKTQHSIQYSHFSTIFLPFLISSYFLLPSSTSKCLFPLLFISVLPIQYSSFSSIVAPFLILLLTSFFYVKVSISSIVGVLPLNYKSIRTQHPIQYSHFSLTFSFSYIFLFFILNFSLLSLQYFPFMPPFMFPFLRLPPYSFILNSSLLSFRYFLASLLPSFPRFPLLPAGVSLLLTFTRL